MSGVCFVFFFKQKTAYEMRISDWSSDVCSSDLLHHDEHRHLCAVLRCIESLLDRELPGVEGQLRLGEDAAISGHRVERSEGRRVGKECVSTCSYRWSPYN